MAPAIGGVSCDFLRGSIPAQKRRLRVWQVPGVDGYGALDYGAGDSAFQLTGVKYGSDATVDAWAASLYALQGTIVSAENDWGDTATTALMVTKVSTVRKIAELGNGGCRGEVVLSGVRV